MRVFKLCTPPFDYGAALVNIESKSSALIRTKLCSIKSKQKGVPLVVLLWDGVSIDRVEFVKQGKTILNIIRVPGIWLVGV